VTDGLCLLRKCPTQPPFLANVSFNAFAFRFNLCCFINDNFKIVLPGHQWLHHVGDAAPASVVESEHKFFQSPHTRNTTGVVFTEPSETYTPHNFLFNKNFNKSYTHAPTIEEFVPKVKANNDNNNNNNNNNDK
jgi:NADH:ubiquinone oxidoreductase subunit